MHARTQRHTHSPPPTHTLWFFQTLISKSCSSLLSALFASPLLSSPQILYTFPRLVGMVTLMGWPLLGDAESGQKEHRHGEKKAIPGWAASTDALLQLGNNRIKFSLKNKREWETIRTQQQQERDRDLNYNHVRWEFFCTFNPRFYYLVIQTPSLTSAALLILAAKFLCLILDHVKDSFFQLSNLSPL